MKACALLCRSGLTFLLLWTSIFATNSAQGRASQAAESTVKVALTGTISDQSGAVIPGATVILIGTQGARFQTTTGPDGRFFFSEIPSGTYSVFATSRGFAEYRQDNLQIGVNQAQSLSITLRVGGGVTVPVSAESYYVTPTWNVWAQKESFRPVDALNVNDDYSIVIDLSAFAFHQGAHSYGKEVSKAVKDILAGPEDPTFLILITPDPDFLALTSPSHNAKPLTIQRQQLKKSLGTTITLNRDPFEELRTNPESQISFGRVAFDVHTANHVGTTAVAISIWSHDHPVDELSVPICIGTEADCGQSEDSISLRGSESVRMATGKDSNSLPEVAIHFVTLDDDSIIGVFRCNACTDWRSDEYHTWRLGRSRKWLIDYLSNTVLTDFEHTTASNVFLRHGHELFEALFPSADTGDGSSSDDTFPKYLATHETQDSARATITIFVRALLSGDDDFVAIPLMLAVSPNGSQQLGLEYRIETPLPYQRYDRSSKCLANWTAFLPALNPNDCGTNFSNLNACSDDLQLLLYGLGSWATSLATASPGLHSYTDIDGYAQWLGTHATKPDDPESLLIMSHHDSDRLYFDPAGTDTIEATGVARSFRTPTFALLNACGTGKPGATEFVRRFNAHGVNSIIATSTTVDAEMAGVFARLFLTDLANHSKTESYRVSDAWFDTVRALTQEKDRDGAEYGARALSYMLIGDAGIRLCAPSQ